jgi:hypothetical protein
MSIITTGLFIQKKMAQKALSELKKNDLANEISLIGKYAASNLMTRLRQWGLSEFQASIIENRIMRGHIMLAVKTDFEKAVDALDILERFDASDFARVAPA